MLPGASWTLSSELLPEDGFVVEGDVVFGGFVFWDELPAEPEGFEEPDGLEDPDGFDESDGFTSALVVVRALLSSSVVPSVVLAASAETPNGNAHRYWKWIRYLLWQ